MQQDAQQQQKLAEDIVRLAEELKKREQKEAQRSAEQAAEAAKKAQRAMEQGQQDEAEQQQEEARQKLEEAAQQLEEEEDRYQDLRQEELLFRMRDELNAFLEKQRPITQQTLEAQKTAPPEGLSRAVRRKLNQLGEEEQVLAGKIEALVAALQEEGNLVYRTVLKANLEDLREVARRLGGRAPDVGTFTTLMQADLERRTEDLLQALERERQRRQQEQQEQQQQQQQQNRQKRNKLQQQRAKLVSLIAELEMLKRLGIDRRRAADDLRSLVEARGDDAISNAEVELIERLAHSHTEISKLFAQIKAGVEEALKGMQGGGDEEEATGGQGRGRNR
jgi:DNA repair exonuclease SbcCD ATPase subunit